MNQQTQRNIRSKENESNIDKAKDLAQEKAAPVREKAGEIADDAKSMMEQAGQQAKSTVSEQKEQAANQLHGVAQALRQTSDQLREQDQGMFANYSNQAADQVERLSGYLQEREVSDLVHEAENFARRQPELFIGGAFTLGLLAARFLKSSAPDSYEAKRYSPTEPTSRTRRTAVSTSHPREQDREDWYERPYAPSD